MATKKVTTSADNDAASAYADIWNNLSAIDVSEYIQNKGGLSYLSWAFAWGVMMEHYPQTVVVWHGQPGEGWGNGEPAQNRTRRSMPDVTYYDGGSAMVSCTVFIGECRRDMWLPVMDYKNKSIANPSTRDISDAKMRCMVKAFAMFGLGHYIYAGEDLPRIPADEAEKKKKHDKTVELIGRVKEAGRLIEVGGITVPDNIRKQIAAAFKSKNHQDLEDAYAALNSLGSE